MQRDQRRRSTRRKELIALKKKIITGAVFLSIIVVILLLTNKINKQNKEKAELQSAEETQTPRTSGSGTIREGSGKPVPLSGKYPDMVVAPKAYKPRTEGDKVIYITIDDGPGKTTPQLLDVLDACGIKATFFVSAQFGTEEEVVGWLREISDRGHEVAVHTYTHEYADIYSSVDAFVEDYRKMDNLIIEATGQRSSVFRFPGGSNTRYNEPIRQALKDEMNSRGLVFHDWNCYDGALQEISSWEQITKAVSEAERWDSAVLLMHNIPGKDSILETLPQITERLREKGYRFDVLDGTVEPYQF